MSDELTNNPVRENDDATRPVKPLLVRMREAFPVAWKHDELFRYALILSALAWLVIALHVGGRPNGYR